MVVVQVVGKHGTRYVDTDAWKDRCLACGYERDACACREEPGCWQPVARDEEKGA